MKRSGEWVQGTGPNESAARSVAARLCARCATYSSTLVPRPRFITRGRRISGGYGDWQRLSAQVETHLFHFYNNSSNLNFFNPTCAIYVKKCENV